MDLLNEEHLIKILSRLDFHTLLTCLSVSRKFMYIVYRNQLISKYILDESYLLRTLKDTNRYLNLPCNLNAFMKCYSIGRDLTEAIINLFLIKIGRKVMRRNITILSRGPYYEISLLMYSKCISRITNEFIIDINYCGMGNITDILLDKKFTCEQIYFHDGHFFITPYSDCNKASAIIEDVLENNYYPSDHTDIEMILPLNIWLREISVLNIVRGINYYDGDTITLDDLPKLKTVTKLGFDTKLL